MKSEEIRNKFLEFFKSKNHKVIPSSPLVPEEDPTVLFTTAGMHSLVPYLLGQKHPSGNRLVDFQKCLRTDDIDNVGDEKYLTFFEMLGNWSLGDYFKEESINYSYEFLIKTLKLDKNRLAVSCFKGDKDAPKDEEAAKIWLRLGIPKERIAFLGKKENWWGPSGKTGPCGPDTEIFYYLGNKLPRDFDSEDKNWVEIWNNVFMQYNKTNDNKFIPLKQKNVDTGMGLERMAMIMQNKSNIYETDLFIDIINKIKSISKKHDEKSIRIIADHSRAAVFILAERIKPSNVEHGYILRRLIRRAIRHGNLIGARKDFLVDVAKIIIDQYGEVYPELKDNEIFILQELQNEVARFENTLVKGLTVFEREVKNIKKILPTKLTFDLYQSYGFPIEMTKELAKEKNLAVNEDEFWEEFKKHQEISRKGSENKFKGGLLDNSLETTRLHTATHLLLQSLKIIVDNNIEQKGSNITKERLRFDFNYKDKLTNDQLTKIENLVNEKIKQGLEITCKEMPLKEAKKIGATGVFEHKYNDKVKVYFIDNFSKEICGGPHVNNTREIGKFKIIREESVASGIRRIKAIIN